MPRAPGAKVPPELICRSADRAGADQRAAVVDGGQARRRNRAVDLQRAGIDVGRAGIGVGAGQHERAGADFRSAVALVPSPIVPMNIVFVPSAPTVNVAALGPLLVTTPPHNSEPSA